MKQNRCKDCHWWKDGDAFEIQSDGKFLPCTNIGVDGWEYWLDTQQEPEDCDGYCKRGEYVPSGVWAGVAKLLTALDMAISALRTQQEQESNEPLTLDELRQMEGKPVWAIDGTGTAAYILIDADGNGIDTDSGFWDADYYGMTKDGKPGLHRMGWLAYRHQLKNTTEG